MTIAKNSVSDIRINARLTGDDARRFLELQRGGTIAASDLLRDALREYYAAHAKSRPNAFALMSESGFVGGGEGDVDLSSRYKQKLTELLSNKYPLQVNEPRAEYPVRRKRK